MLRLLDALPAFILMIKRAGLILFSASFLFFVVFFGYGLAQAELARGYGWSETIGWIKFSGPNYGVVIDGVSSELSGYAWSENIGWIKFGDLSGFPGAPSHSARLDSTTGKITGWARACAGAEDEDNCSGGPHANAGGWDGWIKFSGALFSTEKVNDPLAGCSFSGWAWGSDVVGWIKSTCIAGEPEPDDDLKFGDITCSFFANPNQIIFPRRTSTLVWSCNNADTCTISEVGGVDQVSGSVAVDVPATKSFTLSCSNAGGKTFTSSVQIKVLRPIYCEILPFGPGC